MKQKVTHLYEFELGFDTVSMDLKNLVQKLFRNFVEFEMILKELEIFLHKIISNKIDIIIKLKLVFLIETNIDDKNIL